MKKKIRTARILVVGTGGHARVLVSLIEAVGHFQIVGLLETNTLRKGELIFGYPVIGHVRDLQRFYARGIRQVALAVGDNRERQRLAQQCHKAGFSLPTLIHPTATIDRHAHIEEGTHICMRAVIAAGAEISQGALINTGASIDHECSIGAFAHIAPGCGVAGRVTIGEGAFLGIGTQVIDKIKIGSWVTVGAGSVIVKDLPNRVTAYGIPAKIRKT